MTRHSAKELMEERRVARELREIEDMALTAKVGPIWSYCRTDTDESRPCKKLAKLTWMLS